MHVFITGGAGFIGSHLVQYHLAKGDSVHVLDDLSTGTLANLQLFSNYSQFQWDQADLGSWPGLDAAVGKADRVYHMAAVVGVYRVIAEPLQVLDTNITATVRLLDACAAASSSPHVLMASSSEVYGPSSKPMFAEDDDLIIEMNAQNRWNYPISKLTNEAYALSYVQKKNTRITIARFFNMIGPRQTGRYGMVVPRFVKQALSGGPITVYGDGTQSRSFCDVRDCVKALDKLMQNPQAIGQIVNVGYDEEISITQLAERVRALTDPNLKIDYISYEQAYGEIYYDIPHRRPDLRKFLALTQYPFEWNLEKTLTDLIAVGRGSA